jgi:hypothetical protein
LATAGGDWRPLPGCHHRGRAGQPNIITALFPLLFFCILVAQTVPCKCVCVCVGDDQAGICLETLLLSR